MPNIVLIGYRGSGKTVVAKELGKKLNRNIVNTDNEITKKIGPIKDYVKKNGWESFREIESKVIKNINENNLIIDCGGGVIEKEKNIENLRKNSIIIWLKTDVATIKDRIKKDKNRPSLTGTKSAVDEVKQVLTRRLPLYKKAADYVIDTNNKSVEEICNEILTRVKNEN